MAAKQELVEYIKTNLAKGYSEEQLRQALKQAGYSKTVIDGAFKQAYAEQATPAVPAAPKAPTSTVTVKTGPYQYSVASTEQPLSADTEKILSALGYPIGIIAIVLLVMAKPENRFGKFHGFQALFWNIAYWVFYIVLTVILFPLVLFRGYFTWTLGWLVSLLTTLLWLTFIVLSIIFAIQAYQGKAFRIPVIYGLVPSSSRL